MKVPFLDLALQHRAIRESALAALAATYDSTRFCLGKDVEDFENAFAHTLGYERALALNSGTSPLHLAAALAGWGPGDEIIAPPFTFISTVWGISYVGATPIFVDVDETTFNLDPAKIEAAITPRTKGIVAVHLFGLPAKMEAILAIAQKHHLVVIEDCAQAVGASCGGRPVGTLGDAGTFSFYPTKNLGACGEGGALVSHRSDWFERAKLLRVHGSGRRYFHDHIGFNFRMDGFQGALLSVKLPLVAGWTARRREIAARYLAGIRLSDTRLPVASSGSDASVWHQFTLRHRRRDALRAHLAQQDVGTDLIYPVPLHRQACFAELGYAEGSQPIAEAACATCLSLPIFPELTDAQVDHVIASVNAF